MNQIQIRAGSNLRAILQTTVSFQNLFTELVKNSLQNNATVVKINYDENQATILDNGTGFDHQQDESGLSEFEKYFVYGNSFTKAHKHLNLGQMGIGGKAANDKLSDIRNTHWSLTTKNKHGKAFHLDFKSKDEEYLDDIKPVLQSISDEQSNIPFQTGTRIVIHNLNPRLKDRGWPDQEIRDNLQQFFNMLYFQTKSEDRVFELHVNDKLIEFDNTLPGEKWMHKNIQFNYIMNGEKHRASYELKLNKVNPRTKHLLDCVDLISYTRVQTISWKPDLFSKALNMPEKFEHVTPKQVAQHINSNIRGYVNCPALSDVKDDSGLGAKDLTHHRLNPDHPITQAFMNSLYWHVGIGVAQQMNKQRDPNTKLSNTLNKVCSIMFKHFNIPDEFITKQENKIVLKRRKQQ